MKYCCILSVANDPLTVTQVKMCLLSNRRIVVHELAELASKFIIKLALLQVQSTDLMGAQSLVNIAAGSGNSKLVVLGL